MAFATINKGTVANDGTGDTLRQAAQKINDNFALLGDIQAVTVNISSAEILALNATPKELVAAPGAGKVICPVQITVTLDYNSVAYATNTSLAFFNGAVQVTDTNANLLTATADSAMHYSPTPGTALLPNTNLNAKVATGDPASGNSPIKVHVLYRIITL